MAYQLADEIIAAQSVGDVGTVKKNNLGQTAKIFDPTTGWQGEAIYVSFKASTAVPLPAGSG